MNVKISPVNSQCYDKNTNKNLLTASKHFCWNESWNIKIAERQIIFVTGHCILSLLLKRCIQRIHYTFTLINAIYNYSVPWIKHLMPAVNANQHFDVCVISWKRRDLRVVAKSLCIILGSFNKVLLAWSSSWYHIPHCENVLISVMVLLALLLYCSK